jgi:Arc/MetJ-type ribon-helix-helix transcriptional regulator
MSNVNISEQLYSDLEKIVKDSQEFSDVSAYVSYILQQVVEKKKQQTVTTAAAATASTYSKDDEDKIRERLKNLGYLD